MLPLHGDPRRRTVDRAFIMRLFITSRTGLALLKWAEERRQPSRSNLGVIEIGGTR